MRYSPEYDGFLPWLPSTWPDAPVAWSPEFACIIRQIVEETILKEIGNVISDALAVNGGLQHRGHVIAISLFCAIDALSAYGYSDARINCPLCNHGEKVRARYVKFIVEHFDIAYKQHADRIYKEYRNSVVHSWNLFTVAISSSIEPIKIDGGGSLCLSLVHFHQALRDAVKDFFDKADSISQLQKNIIERYSNLQKLARP